MSIYDEEKAKRANEIDKLAGPVISVDDRSRLNGGDHFGTDVFKSILYRNILEGNITDHLDIGHGTNLKITALADNPAIASIIIGEEAAPLKSDDTKSILTPEYMYKVRLTKEEIMSVIDDEFSMKKMLLEKTYDTLSSEILPEVIADKKLETEKKLGDLEAMEGLLEKLNNPKPKASDFDM